MKPNKPHESQRGYFAWYLYDAMEKDPSIWVLVGDLGYGMMDSIREDFSDRFINCGASEQAMLDIAVGLALTGKKVIVYSIAPFLLARAYETIRNYIDHEVLDIKLVGSGRDKDYAHDGFSHDASDAKSILSNFPNMVEFWPNELSEMKWVVDEILKTDKPCFVSLKR